jgi:hypothetical protein
MLRGLANAEPFAKLQNNTAQTSVQCGQRSRRNLRRNTAIVSFSDSARDASQCVRVPAE